MSKVIKVTIVSFFVLCILQLVCYLLLQYENQLYFYISYYARVSNGSTASWQSYFSKEKLQEFEEELKIRLRVAAKQKINILMWEPSPGNVELSNPDREKCGYCEVVMNKSMADDPDTKAIVFHYAELTWTSLPKHRRPDQFYIWLTMEPLAMLTLQLASVRKYDKIFNLTYTHRLDSDVWRPYVIPDSLRALVDKNPQKIDDLMKKKRKLALWMVSNCKGSTGAIERLKLAKSLVRDGMKVDVGGKCFPDGIKDFKLEDYKFYFSFENSQHCKDYITEKFYDKGIFYGIVPVVFGADKQDYDLIAPPNSYIFASDYSNKELVNLLNYLDKNDTAYKEYFKWREKPITVPALASKYRQRDVCQLCRYLHGINFDNLFSRNFHGLDDFTVFSDTPIRKTIPSLMAWLFLEENKQCVDDYFRFYSRWRERVILVPFYWVSFLLMLLTCAFFFVVLTLMMRGTVLPC